MHQCFILTTTESKNLGEKISKKKIIQFFLIFFFVYSRSIRRSRMRPPTHNDSTLSVADTTGSSIITSPNIAIEEVNSNGSNSEEAIEAS